MISFLNAILLTTAFVEILVAALVYAIFQRHQDTSAKAWSWGCLLMATGMVMLTVRSHLPAPLSFGVINFIMLYALSLHGHSFWLLAHPKTHLPRWPLLLCVGYGVLQWGLSMTSLSNQLSLVAAICWTCMHLFLFLQLRTLASRLENIYFLVFLYLLLTGFCLWVLRVWMVSSYAIPLSTDPKTANLLSIASVHMVLIAQQICYLAVRLSNEKRLKEENERLHTSLQQVWNEHKVAIQVLQDERLQLLRDLHDGFGSKLASLRLLVQKEKLSNAQSIEYLKEIQADLHLFADTLSSEDITLEQALIDMRHRTEARHVDGPPSLRWSLHVEGMPRVRARTSLHILRVIQEAMHNAMRHASAQHIDISVDYLADFDRLTVSIRDDGLGMTPNARKGQGLSNMLQRAREIQARIVWLPAQPGTDVVLTIDGLLEQVYANR